ncbi:MAG: lamin tail domain-containing protein, partial [Sedimentisphaerales bacterium]|nr:lamin tail domain-containing protein [Sedimentisphaerales bacterium]
MAYRRKCWILPAIVCVCLAGSAIAAFLPGDIYQDFKVDIKDLWMFSQDWLSGLDSPANIDGQGIVDGADFALLARDWSTQMDVPMVINEIHYDPEPKTELVEFVELYNLSDQSVDLTGWSFTDGVQYVFPDGAEIASYGYYVVTQDANHFETKFGFAPNGVFEGRLDNDGERIALRNNTGTIVDEVTYKLGFPWPTAGDPPGHSIELIHPALDNDLGGNWKLSGVVSGGGQNALVASNQTWRYFKGTQEPSVQQGAWRQLGFNDSGWSQGNAPIGYDNSVSMGTWLGDMNGSYSTVYLRKTFDVNDVDAIGSLVMEILYDDGFNVWINGTRVTTSHGLPEELSYSTQLSDLGISARESNSYDTFPLPNPHSYLVPGANVIAVQLFNVLRSGSSDCYFDARLIATSGGGTDGPTPGQRNNSYA